MRELSRYAIIQQLLAKKINGTEAAQQLRLTTRQVRRLKRRVERHGPRGLAHASRGKRSNRRLSEKTVQSTLKILRARYADFKPTFACEKLAENHGIQLSDESIRKIMMQGGLWRAKSRRTKSAYHAWRERKASYGELEQFDGSYEAWFEDRAERCCLRRTVQSDFTILYEGLWLQLGPSQPVLVRHKEVIEIEERLDGSLHLALRGKYLNFERLTRKPEKVRMKVLALAHDRAAAPPSANHPWRRTVFSTQKSFSEA